MELIGNVFVVFGGGSGIGREVVLQLLHRRARVAAVDESPEALSETSRLAHANDRLFIHPVARGDRAALQALPQKVLEAHGRLDGVVNLSAVAQDVRPAAETDSTMVDGAMDGNLRGAVDIANAFLPHLQSLPTASLVNVVSIAGVVPFPGRSAYSTSQAAVKAFTEGLIAEHQKARLKVSLVIAGAVVPDSDGNVNGQLRPEPLPVRIGKKDVAPEFTSTYAAADEIVRTLETGKPRVVIGKDAKKIDLVARLLPGKVAGMVATQRAPLVR
ncbi:SDR family NAD(P)-dependent oxidoreductase [Zhihengliuella sp.]|uniref:SDR family NAD(P)-dependent oxidoreductase n=1 Tax=Zhihengliuella sp. TaxID=1954483 RepID=UPI002811BCB6|nr:SDR family NAD(P)-dependent oxidoreductase [Zhihengliuella sp.]